VLLDSHSYFLYRVNERYADIIAKNLKRPLTLEDITNWDFGLALEIIGIPIIKRKDSEPLGAIDYIHEAYTQTEYCISLVDPSVARVTNYLFNTFEVEIVTSNHEPNGLKIVLDSHGINTTKFRQDAKNVTSQYTVVVEDNPNICIDDKQTLLLRDRPWNRDLEAPNVLRFYHSLQLPGILRLLDTYGDLEAIAKAISLGKADLLCKSNIETYGFKLLKNRCIKYK